MRSLQTIVRRLVQCPGAPTQSIEALEPRRLLSVSATGLSGTGVAGTAKAYELATFTTTDPAPKVKNYVATINYEDGTQGKGTVTFRKGVFSVVGHHKYTIPGTFEVQVTISDKVDATSTTVDSSLGIDPAFSKSGYSTYTGSFAGPFAAALGETFRRVGLNYKARTITATRISDRSDHFWSGSIVSADAIAAYSSSSQTFGYVPGTSGGNPVWLFAVTGTNAAAEGGVGFTPITGQYRLARTGNDGNVYTSNPSDNADHRDHMVTFLMSGLGTPAGEKTYVVFFEDSLGGGDGDFNDLIVELTIQG